MRIRADGLWAGSQESHDAWAKLDAAVDEKLLAYNPNDDKEDDEDKMPYLLEKQGGVAVKVLERLFNRSAEPGHAAPPA